MKLSFNARELKAFADKNGNTAHDLSTTAEELELAQKRYAKMYSIFKAIWLAVEDGSGEVTIRTLTTESKVMVDSDILFKLANLLAPVLGEQLSGLQSYILQLGEQYEAGDNDFQFEATDQEWDIKRVLHRDFVNNTEVVAA